MPLRLVPHIRRGFPGSDMAEEPNDLAAARQLIERAHGENGPFVQAVDATSMAMIITDCRLPDNPTVFANPAFLRLTGYARDEVIGRNYCMLYGTRTDPEARRKVEEALNADGDMIIQLMLYRKDGTGVWVLQHVAVQREDGLVKRHFASFWNVDRLVRADRTLRRAHVLTEQRVARRTKELSQVIEEVRLENERRRAAEEVLRNTLEDKDRLLHEREMLAKEVNHRVKNTLQMVSSLLTVQAGTTQEAAVTEGLQAAVARMDRLAEIHRLLYESADLGVEVALDTYLGYLCGTLMAAVAVDPHRVNLLLDVEEGRWSVDQAIPIALIVNEALTNALKYAFPGDRQGTIKVSLRHVGQQYYELAVADDGVGATMQPRPGSLGLKLIHTFARQLRGMVNIEQQAGTRITVRFRHEGNNLPLATE